MVFIWLFKRHGIDKVEVMVVPVIDSMTARNAHVDGIPMLNFTSNDYLGMAMNPAVCAHVKSMIDDVGLGATGSRRLSGNHAIMMRVEQSFATWLQKEAAVLFNSGYQMNRGIFSMFDPNRHHIIADKLCHASLSQGMVGSGVSWSRFRHNHMGHLESQLRKYAGKKTCVIVCESLYSMDGDSPDYRQLVTLKHQYNALLMVDEAHAIGCFGPSGRGLMADYIDDVDVLLVAFGKAFGLAGGMVLASAAICDHIKQTNPAYIYTTALPLPIVSALEFSRALIHTFDAKREALMSNIQTLKSHGILTSSVSQIQPIIIGDADRCHRAYRDLYDGQIYLKAIHHPTVPMGTSRLRVSITSDHSTDDIRTLAQGLAACVPR
ncbi:MAG: aminotransferase class I/II-fold pyridoxal phosphate-dependent enzyme [Candidatus Marinamargulisbacteria bacterium]